MIGIARKTITDNFGIYLCAARLGMLIFFQHDNASTLAHHKAIACHIIGAARLFGRVIKAGGEGLGPAESRNANGTDGAFRAACQHDVGIVHRDHSCSIANRVCAGRAGGNDCVVRTHQAV